MFSFFCFQAERNMRVSGISRSTDEIEQYGKRSSITFLRFLVIEYRNQNSRSKPFYVFFLLLFCRRNVLFSGISRCTDEIEQYGKRSSLTFLDFLLIESIEKLKFANKTFLIFLSATFLQKKCDFCEYLGPQMR